MNAMTYTSTKSLAAHFQFKHKDSCTTTCSCLHTDSCTSGISDFVFIVPVGIICSSRRFSNMNPEPVHSHYKSFSVLHAFRVIISPSEKHSSKHSLYFSYSTISCCVFLSNHSFMQEVIITNLVKTIQCVYKFLEIKLYI